MTKRSAMIDLLAGLMLAAPLTANAQTIDGIHLQRSGISPFLVKLAMRQIEAMRMQCAQLQKTCALVPAGAGAAAKCGDTAGGFRVKGEPATVGQRKIDEYFVPGKRMAAQWVTARELFVDSPCAVEIREVTHARIRHHRPDGWLQFELIRDRAKGEYWKRSHLPRPPAETASLLDALFLLPGSVSVSPTTHTETHRGHRCQRHALSGAVNDSACLKVTGLDFPGHLRLAGRQVSGGEALAEETLNELTLNTALSSELFHPPAHASIVDSDIAARAADNPTQKWCRRQEARTGVNPCKESINVDD